MAAAQPNVTMREGSVLRLIAADGSEWREESSGAVAGVEYKADGATGPRQARAHLSVACDGMYSNLRKRLHADPTMKLPSTFVGLLLKGVPLPYPAHGHVVLAKPSPILVYPISSKELRVLVDIPGSVKMPSQSQLKVSIAHFWGLPY